MPEPVIVAAVRSPIGRAFKGSMVEVRPDDLSAKVIEAALSRVPQLDPDTIDDLMLGCGLPGGEQGFNIARVVSVLMGRELPGTTVTRYCASSVQTMRMAAHAIKAGEGEAFICAGVETVSRYGAGSSDVEGAENPRFESARMRSLKRSEGGQGEWNAPDGLPDVYIAMGQTAENVAEIENVSREEMDQYALQSQQRTAKAIEKGLLEREIVPIELPNGETMTADDGPRPDTTLEKLASLKPVFRPDGTVTAGNACPLNDGAAAVIVMSDEKASQLGITPIARIVSTGVSALNPEIMGLGPVEASRQALARAGKTIDEIDLVEINEAFAAQVIPSARSLGIPMDKLNVNGGAIALGHPFGMTGARIMTTLLNGLEDAGKSWGLETMCVGGGQGMAIIVERLH